MSDSSKLPPVLAPDEKGIPVSLPALDDQLGSWVGTWTTFLEPEILFDDSPIEATVTAHGTTYTLEYSGSIGDDDVSGRLRWSVDGDAVDWVDSWHTMGVPERLEGSPPSYRYDDGRGHLWTWDVEIVATADTITIIHSNAGPGTPRYTGVLMRLMRN